MEDAAKRLTGPITIRKQLRVGRIDAVETTSFIDLMGATCKPENAIQAAQLLSSHWRNLIGAAGTQEIPDFDFVVAPKAGSPFIAYEFAKLHQKPLLLHNEQPKFQSDDVDFAALFDAAYKPKAGARALIPAYSPNTRFQSARERVGDGFDLFCGFGTASRDGSGVIQAADG